MSILGFLFKSKKEMARENTKQVKVGKYTLTSHVQNRIADKTRKTSKVDVIDNLFTRPNAKTNVRIDEFGRPSYNRVGKRITTSVNPENHNVVSCRPISKQETKKFSEKRYLEWLKTRDFSNYVLPDRQMFVLDLDKHIKFSIETLKAP